MKRANPTPERQRPLLARAAMWRKSFKTAPYEGRTYGRMVWAAAPVRGRGSVVAGVASGYLGLARFRVAAVCESWRGR